MNVSPKFPNRRTKLLSVVTLPALRKSWKNDVRAACRGQCLLDLLDYQDIHSNLDFHSQRLIGALSDGSYKPNPPIRVLSEKSKGLCRQLVVPDPIDALLLQVLVDSIYPSVKKNEPTDKAFYQPQSHKFSTRRRGRFSSRYYGGLQAWLNFQKGVFGFAKAKEFLVVTDIANYYDFVDLEEIRRMYVSFNDLDEDIIDLIFHVISHFHWYPDYMPTGTRGLPQMNLDAPRLLAHSFLFELDKFLSEKAPKNFVRYMDDIDIGVDTVGEAKVVLRDIDNVLRTRGVRLNSGKTQILRSGEADRFYFIELNGKLDLVQAVISRKMSKRSASPTSLARETSYVRKMFQRYWRKRGYFDVGQGDKVLKRFIGLSLKLNFELPTNTLKSFIKTRSSLRELVLRAIPHYGYSRKKFLIIRDYVASDVCVDEASLFYVAKALVDLNAPKSKNVVGDILKIADLLGGRGRVGVGAAIWILSKYGNVSQISAFLNSNKDSWQGDHWLGRQVGALAPLFKKSGKPWKDYFALVKGSRNSGAQDALRYHLDLGTDKRQQDMAYDYLKAPNPSQPNSLAYQKILVLMSFLLSNADKTRKNALRSIYRGMNLDTHHKALLKGL